MFRALRLTLAPIAAFAVLIGLGRAFPAIAGVLDLSLPFFGLIGLGYVCGRVMDIPESGLGWMNFFILYVALPALFFNLVSVTPLDQLSNWRFILGTTLSTGIAFALALGLGLRFARGDLRSATMQGFAGAYSNIGYMGPGLTLAALGPLSTAPTALIFAFDNILLFTLVPICMALGGGGKTGAGAMLGGIARRIVTHPFNMAIVAGVIAAALHWQPPVAIGKTLSMLQNAAAPAALFVMGATIALRPVGRVAPETPAIVVIKLVFHPLLVWVALSLLGDFGREWTFTAVLMAALPPALNVFIVANQYGVYVERASSIILVGTLVSVATVTALLYAMSSGAMPYRLFQP